MLQHLRNRLTPRTLLFALLAVLGVAVMAFSSLKVNQRQHDARWEAQPATPSAGAIPAQENALIGGMRHNRDTMIEQQHALTEVRQTLALLQAENADLKAQLTETQHHLSLASGSGHDDSLSAEETRQLIAEQVQFMRQALAEQNPPAQTPPPAPPPEQILDAPAERLPAYEPPEPLRDWVRIPDRSTATAVTLSGSAGQANGEPFPVNVQIESDLTGPGPAYTRIPLSGCRVGAEGIVEAVPARSLFRINSLSCTFTLADGRIQPVEVEARGWLTGPDNINGGLARIFHNEGEIYKRFGQASIPVALVSLLKETRQVVRTLTPLGLVTTVGNDVAQEVASDIAAFYIDKAREYFDPLAWVPDNQRVYVHFDGGVTLPIERHAIRRPYAALANRYSAYR